MSQGNPLFNEKAFNQAAPRVRAGEEMTLQGTINKTFILLFLCVVAGMFAWKNYPALSAYVLPISLVSFVIAMITIFRKTSAPFLAPVYAIGEGLVLGVISAAYNVQYQGIVGQAISITLLVFAIMLFIYKTGIIKVTQGFVIGVTAATGFI